MQIQSVKQNNIAFGKKFPVETVIGVITGRGFSEKSFLKEQYDLCEYMMGRTIEGMELKTCAEHLIQKFPLLRIIKRNADNFFGDVKPSLDYTFVTRFLQKRTDSPFWGNIAAKHWLKQQISLLQDCCYSSFDIRRIHKG